MRKRQATPLDPQLPILHKAPVWQLQHHYESTAQTLPSALFLNLEIATMGESANMLMVMRTNIVLVTTPQLSNLNREDCSYVLGHLPHRVCALVVQGPLIFNPTSHAHFCCRVEDNGMLASPGHPHNAHQH